MGWIKPLLWATCLGLISLAEIGWAQPTSESEPASSSDLIQPKLNSDPDLEIPPGEGTPLAIELGLDSEVVESSPVLQRWLTDPPDLLDEIRNTPAVPTRLQAGVDVSGWSLGISDLYLFNRLSLSSSYHQSFDRPQDATFGSNLRYFVAPVGSRLNLAPQVGYGRLDQFERSLKGPQFGAYVVLALDPGAADLTLSYNWLEPDHSTQEGRATVGEITTSYALSPSTRLAARYTWRHSTITKDQDLSLILEWVP